MGRPPCCDKASVKKGPWTPEEDAKLLAYTSTHGTGNWTSVPQRAGLKRCGKSCRLRYTNYLRPNLKHDSFTQDEEDLIVTLHAMLGSRWSLIANQLPGRTDNDVKNYWNTKLSKKLRQRGIDPITHRPIADLMQSIGTLAIRPPPVAAYHLPPANHSSNNLAAAAAAIPLLHDDDDDDDVLLYHHHAGLQQQQQQVVVTVVDADAPVASAAVTASPEHQLKWSDFLADDEASSQTQVGVLGGTQYLQEEAPAAVANDGGGGGGRACGDVEGADGGGGDDGAAFIDAILDSDREMVVDQLIADLLADPAYYGGSSSEMEWGC